MGKATGNPFLGSTWSLGHYHSRKSPVEKFMSLFPFLICQFCFGFCQQPAWPRVEKEGKKEQKFPSIIPKGKDISG